MVMLKRVALMLAATAALAVPATGALAGPAQPAADGVLPDQACHAVYPYHAQPLLCGRGKGGPGSG
jgi:hypothetical protein